MRELAVEHRCEQKSAVAFGLVAVLHLETRTAASMVNSKFKRSDPSSDFGAGRMQLTFAEAQSARPVDAVMQLLVGEFGGGRRRHLNDDGNRAEHAQYDGRALMNGRASDSGLAEC